LELGTQSVDTACAGPGGGRGGEQCLMAFLPHIMDDQAKGRKAKCATPACAACVCRLLRRHIAVYRAECAQI
jgi:hypothetical protein